MAISIVTSGYLNVVILVIALYLAIKSGKAWPVALDDKMEVNPIIVLNVERLLATALALGLFFVAITFVFAPMFTANVNALAILP